MKNNRVVERSDSTMLETFNKLLKILKKSVYWFLGSAIMYVLVIVIFLQAPRILGKMTDILASGISVSSKGMVFNIDYNAIFRQLVLAFSVYIFVMLCQMALNLILYNVTVKLYYDIRTKINDKINQLPISYLDKVLDGNIISLVVNDTSRLLMSFYTFVSSAIPAIVTIVVTIIIMLTITPKLTLVVVIFIPITFAIIILVVIFSQKYFKMQQEKLATLNEYIEEMYSNHDIIQAYNGQEKTMEKFNEINEDLYETAFLSQFLSGLVFPLVTITNNISFVLISLFGSVMLFKGRLSLGNLQSFIQYLNNFHPALSQLSQISTYVQQIKAASDRLFDFLELEELKDESSFEKLDIEKFEGNIEFKNVKFSYSEDKEILKDISFKINKGQKVAIVGHTGSGKTTIINLLMKFYDINSGDILLDGRSIKTITREDIRKVITMVLQDTWLFEGTIRENIAFGSDKEVSLEEIKKASKSANSHHFIKSQPDTYNMVLNEEISNVSIGQKQLLTIARAFLKNSKMLILDEATSSIDSRTEKLVQESMKRLMSDKTTIIIAHRLSTIRECDLIILLDDGKIVEIGNHEELMQKDGAYKKLYTSQF